MRRLTIFCAAILCAACGDTDSKDNSNTTNNAANNGGSCNLTLPLEGAVSKTLSWGEAEGCAGATSGGLATLTFGAFGRGFVSIGFADAFDELGTHEVYVRFRDVDESEWTAQDCSVDLTTNEVVETDPDFGDTYLFGGTGSCSSPAPATGGSAEGELTFGEFSFQHDGVPGPN